MKNRLLFLGLICFILNSCCKCEENKDEYETKWWILVHPSYGNSGIYLYNETTSNVELRLDIPNGLTSTHALSYDGESLWIDGGSDSSCSIFEISPIDGSILSEIKDVCTEGIASSGDYLYYSSRYSITKIKKNGILIDTFNIQSEYIQDIAIDGSYLYYVVNGETDPIIQVDTKTEKQDTIIETGVIGLYTLCISDDNFIVVTDNNEIRRIDMKTKRIISDKKTGIEGWITAITPYH